GLPRPGDRPCEPMRPRAPGHRLLAACGLAGLVALLLFGLLAPAAGARPRQAGGAALTLVDQNTWLHDGEAFGATVRVTGAPAGASLRVVAHGALETRRDFEESLAGELG